MARKSVMILTILILSGFRSFSQIIEVPSTSGLSGHLAVLPGFLNVSSNTIATGAPANGDVGYAQIPSIFEAPQSKSVFALPVAIEANYTFSKSKTQIWLGNRMEDLLRLDVTFGLGVRQELPDSSILALSFVFTPLALYYWEDPFIENLDRQKTALSFPGVRLRWHKMFKTGLEFTATYRQYNFENERSGDWLVSEGRLQANQQSLLVRDGNVLRLQLLYRIRNGKHLFEPAIRYVNDYHEGDALANQGGAFRLTYMYLTRRVILDFNVGYGRYQADAVHPVYNETLESNQFGTGAIVIVPVKMYKSSRLSLFANAEYIVANRNVAFYDSDLFGVFLGAIWNHIRR